MNNNGHKLIDSPATYHANGNGKNGKTPAIVYPPTIPDILQPNSVEAEEAVLGSLLIDPDAIVRVETFLQPEDFYIERHRWVYDVIKTLHSGSSPAPADLVTVSDLLEKRGQLDEIGGWAYISSLINECPTAIHCEYYANIVFNAAELRRLIESAGKIARLAYDAGVDYRETFDRAEEILFSVTGRKNGKGGPALIRGAVDRYYDRLEYLSNHQSAIIGIPTGFSDLDKLLGGLQRSDMITLAGRPGMGKTSLALNIARHATRQFGKRVAIFSLEMSDEQLTQRLISSESGIDSQRLRRGDIKKDEWSTLLQASGQIAQSLMFIDDTPAISASELRSKSRRLQAETGLDLLIVDYLQLMRGDKKSENRQQEVSYISRSIKALARELNIPVLALSQLSRQCESRHDKRPMLSDLRDSGSIEQDSDVVLFVYRDEEYNPDTEFPNVAELIVAKHRSGPTGVLSLYFKKRLTQFVDLEMNTQRLEPAL